MATEDRGAKFEQELIGLQGSLLALKDEWFNKGVYSCVEGMMEAKVKTFQEGYNFALDKLSLPVDHELRVEDERPESDVEEEEKDTKQQMRAEEPNNEVADDCFWC